VQYRIRSVERRLKQQELLARVDASFNRLVQAMTQWSTEHP
jgi:hypothetical protein